MADRLLTRLRERDELARVGVIRLERRSDERVDRRVVDPAGRELERDPLIDPHGTHAGHIAGAGAESEAIERVADLLVGGLLARLRGRDDQERGRRSIRRAVGRAASRRGARDADGQRGQSEKAWKLAHASPACVAGREWWLARWTLENGRG